MAIMELSSLFRFKWKPLVSSTSSNISKLIENLKPFPLTNEKDGEIFKSKSLISRNLLTYKAIVIAIRVRAIARMDKHFGIYVCQISYRTFWLDLKVFDV